MLFHVLISLTFCVFSSSGSSSAEDSQCALFNLNNITKETQSSLIINLLNNCKNVLEDAKKYATILTSCSASAYDSQCASFLLKNITDEIQSSAVLNLVNNAKSLLENVEKYTRIKTRCSDVETGRDRPGRDRPVIDQDVIESGHDCAEVKEKNSLAHSGVYKIWPRNETFTDAVEVYCDMEDDGGAWTVLQRRGDFGREKDYFYKDWLSYKMGFGDPAKDYWIGNDNIFALTNQRSNVVKFTLTDWEGNQTYATYDEFWIDDEFHKYKLHVSGYKGTAGDSLSNHNGMSFTTKDQDNDLYSDNCAVLHKGGWWYKDCMLSNLNGLHWKGKYKLWDGVAWSTFKGYYYSLKDTEIKIRPKDFQKKLLDVTTI